MAHASLQEDFALMTDALRIAVSISDGFITGQAPWKLAKSTLESDRDKLNETLYVAAEMIRIITGLFYPILPFATASVWRQLGLGEIEDAAKRGELTNLKWGGLQPGTKLGALAPIFPRADKGLAQMMADMEAPATAPLSNVTAQNDTLNPASDDLPIASLASEPPPHDQVPVRARLRW